jgi:hypothetical protein
MKAGSGIGARRAAEFRHRAFWEVFDERHPQEKSLRARHGPWFWQRGLPAFEMVITMYVAPEQDLVGVFFGQNEKLGAVQVDKRLRPHFAALEARLKLRLEHCSAGPGLGAIWRVNCFAEDNWPAMADWLVTEASRFERAVVEVLGAAG